MFVPLDNLYEFISHKISNDSILIYQFYPTGSRKIKDIQRINKQDPDWHSLTKAMSLFMHDQEPLDFHYYSNLNDDAIYEFLQQQKPMLLDMLNTTQSSDLFITMSKNSNLRIFNKYQNILDKWMLCHSEKNSQDLQKYEEIGAIGVYWWSHALISKDWYRFAKIDQRLDYFPKKFSFDFNIYSRAWQGTREYRLKMLDLCIEKNLAAASLINFGKIEKNIDWKDHCFKNPQFDAIHQDLDCLDDFQISSSASATYSSDDYQKCAIDVVLETLFDDCRNHLTEKILRPIACGKPFILVSTPGSLEYLKSYGFETFSSLIDESYDTVEVPLDRLNRITDLMKDISTLPPHAKESLYDKMHLIAQKNKQRFWSDEFFQTIVSEFYTNYQQAFTICQSSANGKNWLEWRKAASAHSQIFREFATTSNNHRNRKDILSVMMEIKKIKS